MKFQYVIEVWNGIVQQNSSFFPLSLLVACENRGASYSGRMQKPTLILVEKMFIDT